MKRIILSLFLIILSIVDCSAQLPCNVMVGYWQNSWGTAIRIKDIDTKYNVICLAFLEADKNLVSTDNTIANLEFTPTSVAQVKADIPIVQGQGRKVLISIGGGTGSFKLNSVNDKNTLVSKVKTFITDYGVDGIDLDLEQSVYVSQAGTISSPSTHITYVIQALQELLSWYQTTYSKKMILTMAPEVAYTTGGYSDYMSKTYGASYLAIIEALHDEIDLVMVQLYNASGGSYGLDNVVYYQGTADFIVSQTEAMIKGFTCKNGKGTYTGLRANQIAVALPARTNASGYCSPAVVKSAVDYLRGTGPKPGSYTLQKVGGYKGLRGLMTWSINEDKDNANAFVNNYATIFTSCLSTDVENVQAVAGLQIYPNPSESLVFIQGANLKGKSISFYNSLGALVLQQQSTENKVAIDVSGFSTGLYFVNVDGKVERLIVK
ncbi:MAG: glycosyl hydrolase family 18 protein [Flavobacteriales bacterium]